jgi:hypothetical protein
MAISSLTTTLTTAGNQGASSGGDYSSAPASTFQISYANIGYTPSTINAYVNDFAEELRLYINGVRIYRLSTDTAGDDTELTANQKAKLDALNISNSTEPWTINTTGKYIQINDTHTAFGNTDTDNPGYPAKSAWYIVKITRIKSDKTTLSTNFQNASVLTESELDNAFLETFHIAQEAFDTTATGSLTKDTDDIWNAANVRIKNLGQPQNANDAVRKVDVDTGIGADITTVAGLSTEITRLGTTDAVADMAILAGTSASGNSIVEDINTLATSDIVADLNTLASSDIISDMNALAVSDVLTNMSTIVTGTDGGTGTGGSVTNLSNINTVSTNIGTISAKVSKSGDTMTGALTLSGAPASADHATTKTYVDTQDTTTEANALSNSIVFSIALG